MSKCLKANQSTCDCPPALTHPPQQLCANHASALSSAPCQPLPRGGARERLQRAEGEEICCFLSTLKPLSTPTVEAFPGAAFAEQASQSSGHQGHQRQEASAPHHATPCHASSRTPERRVCKLHPQARSIHLPDFINKLLLEHSRAQ